MRGKEKSFCGHIMLYVYKPCETVRKVCWEYLNVRCPSWFCKCLLANIWSLEQHSRVSAGLCWCHHYSCPGVFDAVSGRTAYWLLSCSSSCSQSVPGLVWSLMPQFLAVLSVSLEFMKEYFTKFWDCIFSKMWKLPTQVFNVDFVVLECYVTFSEGKLQPSL